MMSGLRQIKCESSRNNRRSIGTSLQQTSNERQLILAAICFSLSVKNAKSNIFLRKFLEITRHAGSAETCNGYDGKIGLVTCKAGRHKYIAIGDQVGVINIVKTYHTAVRGRIRISGSSNKRYRINMCFTQIILKH